MVDDSQTAEFQQILLQDLGNEETAKKAIALLNLSEGAKEVLEGGNPDVMLRLWEVSWGELLLKGSLLEMARLDYGPRIIFKLVDDTTWPMPVFLRMALTGAFVGHLQFLGEPSYIESFNNNTPWKNFKPVLNGKDAKDVIAADRVLGFVTCLCRNDSGQVLDNGRGQPKTETFHGDVKFEQISGGFF